MSRHNDTNRPPHPYRYASPANLDDVTSPYAGILPVTQPQYPSLPLGTVSNLPNQWPTHTASNIAASSPRTDLEYTGYYDLATHIARKRQRDGKAKRDASHGLDYVPPQDEYSDPFQHDLAHVKSPPPLRYNAAMAHKTASSAVPRQTPAPLKLQGTQHYPLEIESSPEPETLPSSKRRKKKEKHWYAVVDGPSPGIYQDWTLVELLMIKDRDTRWERFTTEREAGDWYDRNKSSLKRHVTSDGFNVHGLSKGTSNLAEDFSYSGPAEYGLPRTESLSRPGPPTASSSMREGNVTSNFSAFMSPHKATTIPPVATNNAISDIVPIVEPTLCKEQADLVELIMRRRNVFYTGSAGCGKSTVLKAFVKQFQAIGMRVDIIAPTGRAALDINGSTTWTYAGWTPDHHKKPLDELTKAAHGKFVSRRMRETDVLVIDEISMVENLHFERLNAVMKAARGSSQAFGGVQLVVTGDFCQLPPVKPFGHCIKCGRELVPLKQGAEYRCRDHGIYLDIDKWAFRSQAWEECDFAHVNLTTIHRQSDNVFIDILNKLRIGNPLSTHDRDLLLNHEHSTRNAIMLFPTRAEVKRVNDEMFNKLRSQPRPYLCLDHFKWNEAHGNLAAKSRLSYDGMSLLALADHRYEPNMQLKKGMLVVLLHNLDLPAGLVNGSQGTIQGFEDHDPSKMPKAAPKAGEKKDRYAEALVGNPSLAGDYAAFREAQLKEYIEKAPFKKWPIVTFLNGVTRTIYADCTVNELGDKSPYSLLSRTQIPLMAAWAMTTHKSQGMTLNRVRVDLAKAFEEGQAYVALSRARSLEGLEVIALPPAKQLQTGNPQVKEFLQEKFNH